MYSNEKLVIDLLLSIFAVFILSTTILSISTTGWNIDIHQNRTGLFQQCLDTCCCETKELNRTITMLLFFSIILLLTSTLISCLLMTTSNDNRNRCYLFVPVTLFGAGIAMTLTLIQILDRMSLNGYSAFIFIIDTVLTYVLGGITILHGSMFYF
jgi:hypothetical protein